MLFRSRTPVFLVAIARDVHGASPEAITKEVYPHLSLVQVEAALASYDSHKSEIDASIQREEQLFQTLRVQSDQPSREELLQRLHQKQAS